MLIDAMALLITIAATVVALISAVRRHISRANGPERRAVWLSFSRWLVAALTFQLASDIIESSIATSWEAMGRLAAIAFIRTFLNYFLERDLSELQERQQSQDREPMSSTTA